MKTTDKCKICGWSLADSRLDGCVEGDCSYRPEYGSKEYQRIEKNRRALTAQQPVRGEALNYLLEFRTKYKDTPISTVLSNMDGLFPNWGETLTATPAEGIDWEEMKTKPHDNYGNCDPDGFLTDFDIGHNAAIDHIRTIVGGNRE